MKRSLSVFLLLVLLLTLTLPGFAVRQADDPDEIIPDGETVYTYENWLCYTVSPEGEAFVREILYSNISYHAARSDADVIAIPPTLSGYPVRTVSLRYEKNDYTFRPLHLLIPDSVRAFSLEGLVKCRISKIYFFSASISAQIHIPLTPIDVYCFEHSGVESCASYSVSVHFLPADRYENGCLYTDTVVDMIAPVPEDHQFTIPVTLGGKRVTGIHCDSLIPRFDIRVLTVPKDAHLLDLSGDDVECDSFWNIVIRCPLNSVPNTDCFRYKISCRQILPDGSEHLAHYRNNNIDAAFSGEDCTCTRWEVINGEVYIRGWRTTYDWGGAAYFAAPSALHFPAQIDGRPVVYVGGLRGESASSDHALYLHSITLPETVRTVGSFSYQTIIDINLDFVETVEPLAFSDCGLGNADLRFGKNLQQIGKGAFSDTTSPRSVTFDPDCPLETLEVGALGFDGYIYSSNSNWPDLVLPHHIKTVKRNAVSGVGHVVFPTGTQSVDPNGVRAKDYIVMLSRDVELAEASLACSLLYCYADSTAHRYALEHHMAFTLLDEIRLQLDGTDIQTPFIPLSKAADREALRPRLQARGDVRIALPTEQILTTGSVIALRSTFNDEIMDTYTIVCRGDVDRDGKTDTWSDWIALLRILLKQSNPDDAAYRAADADADGRVTVRDLFRGFANALRQTWNTIS